MIKHGKGVPDQEKPRDFYTPNSAAEQGTEGVLRAAVVVAADDLVQAAEEEYLQHRMHKAKRALRRNCSAHFRKLASRYVALHEEQHA